MNPLVVAVFAQAVLCCNLNINVDGDWVGSWRVENCQAYLDEAPIQIARSMCRQRGDLKCLDSRRCDNLPAFKDTTAESDRAGLEEGLFDEAPPKGKRFVDLEPTESTTRREFTAWLDGAACPLAIEAIDKASYAVEGRITRREGKTRIEATARKQPGDAKAGTASLETIGSDADAVATAFRGVLRRLKLLCDDGT
jgi:hypothetical protein